MSGGGAAAAAAGTKVAINGRSAVPHFGGVNRSGQLFIYTFQYNDANTKVHLSLPGEGVPADHFCRTFDDSDKKLYHLSSAPLIHRTSEIDGKTLSTNGIIYTSTSDSFWEYWKSESVVRNWDNAPKLPLANPWRTKYDITMESGQHYWMKSDQEYILPASEFEVGTLEGPVNILHNPGTFAVSTSQVLVDYLKPNYKALFEAVKLQPGGGGVADPSEIENFGNSSDQWLQAAIVLLYPAIVEAAMEKIRNVQEMSDGARYDISTEHATLTFPTPTSRARYIESFVGTCYNEAEAVPTALVFMFYEYLIMYMSEETTTDIPGQAYNLVIHFTYYPSVTMTCREQMVLDSVFQNYYNAESIHGITTGPRRPRHHAPLRF